MEIKKVISDKKEFLELLLLADEQESMIDRYLERGDMFVLYDDGLKACCVVTCEGERIYEIKNIATISFFQRQGYGKRLIQFLFEHYQGRCSEMLVGTGDVPSTRSFYEHCGFTISGCAGNAAGSPVHTDCLAMFHWLCRSALPHRQESCRGFARRRISMCCRLAYL